MHPVRPPRGVDASVDRIPLTTLAVQESRWREWEGTVHYSKVRREKRGPCNLCRVESKLTWDHVPPQGALELSAVEMRTVLQAFTGDDASRFRISQNGVKYRTLCKTCNERLGKEFDPVLNNLSRDVGRHLRSPLILPEIVKINTKPQRLIRAILGHLIAAKTELDEVDFDRDVGRVLFDKESAIPPDVHIFYWLHPYPIQVVLRDVLMPARRGDFSSFMFCHVLKYFPVAFLIANVAQYEGLPSLTRWRDTQWDDEVELRFSLSNIRGPHWPEEPADGNILFGGQAAQSSVIGTPRKSRSARA